MGDENSNFEIKVLSELKNIDSNDIGSNDACSPVSYGHLWDYWISTPPSQNQFENPCGPSCGP